MRRQAGRRPKTWFAERGMSLDEGGNDEIALVFLKCGGAILIGILLGNGAVWFFNRIPGKWLCDYDQEPDEELLHPTMQRLKSTPWKYVFSALFIVIGIYLFLYSPPYALAAEAALWLLLEMSVADIKYRIVPDQLIMLLVVTGFGFIPFHPGGPLSGLWGALAGFGVMAVMAVLGGLLYRKNTLGGGDIKLFAALGLLAGLDGILIIFVLTALISGAHMTWLLIRRRVKLTDHRAMVPYIAVSAGIYLVLLHEIRYNILISI